MTNHGFGTNLSLLQILFTLSLSSDQFQSIPWPLRSRLPMSSVTCWQKPELPSQFDPPTEFSIFPPRRTAAVLHFARVA